MAKKKDKQKQHDAEVQRRRPERAGGRSRPARR